MLRILILMSDTGGGHRASAEALRAAFAERYGSRYDVQMVDLWSGATPWPINQVPRSYPFLASQGLWLWRALWRGGESALLRAGVARLMAHWAFATISRAIRLAAPDVIISVHPLLQAVPLHVLGRMHRKVPFVTVVTDLASIHPTWFDARADLCFLPSEGACAAALRAGLPPDRIRVRGLPIHPRFARPPGSRDDIRRALGLLPDLPTALVMGGGAGIGRIEAIADAIADRLGAGSSAAGPAPGQLAVICGRNRDLLHRLQSRHWPVPATVTGFVQNVPQWLAAADCVVTKAGPGAIAEALACGVPMVLSGYIPGQESGNVPYVVGHGAGVFVRDPARIADTVCFWFGEGQAARAAMAEQARTLGRPHAALDIAGDIAAHWPA